MERLKKVGAKIYLIAKKLIVDFGSLHDILAIVANQI